MLSSKDQIMFSNILDNSMDQEMIPGPNGSYESQNPIEVSKLQICKSTRKGLRKRSMRLRIMFSWYLLQNWMNLIL